MLASPLMPTSTATFSPSHPPEDQYRPSRDLDAFNKLLPPPIEFVEGSSSGTLAVPEGKYEPINTEVSTPRVTHQRSMAYIAQSSLKSRKLTTPSRMAR